VTSAGTTFAFSGQTVYSRFMTTRTTPAASTAPPAASVLTGSNQSPDVEMRHALDSMTVRLVTSERTLVSRTYMPTRP
jgi:hypothetical protein